jgi:hypothetical protein
MTMGAVDAGNAILAGIGALAGVSITGSSKCVCVAAIACNSMPWMPGWDECVTTAARPMTSLELSNALNVGFELALGKTSNAEANLQTWQSLFSQAEQVVKNANDVEYLGGAIIMRPPPSPSPDKPPSPWWFPAGGMAYLAFRMNGADLERVMEMYRDVIEETMLEEGYEYCPLLQDFRPIDDTPLAPHPLLLGYCTKTGLPIININYPDENYVYEAISRHAIETFTLDGYEFSNIFGFHSLTWHQLLIDGLQLESTTISMWAFHNIRDGGFIANQRGEIFSVWYAGESRGLIRARNVSLTDLVTQPAQAPNTPAPNVRLAETNALNDLDALMDLIREIAHHPDLEGDDVIVTVPLLQPEFFPDIPPEHFQEFVREFLENLTIEHIIMPGHEAITIINNVPEITIDLSEVTGLLQRILAVLQNILTTIGNLPPNIATSIRDITQPNDDDLPALYVPEEMDFDFKVYLMDYFPFSLPRDFADIVGILFGTIPPEMAGATTHERAVFFHYQELGYLSAEGYEFLEPLFKNAPESMEVIPAEGYAAIEPMFINNLVVTPRFEFHVPLPNFSTGRIWLGYPEAKEGDISPFPMDNNPPSVIHVATLDFDDYPTLVAIIRLGIFLIFLMAIINASTKMLVW